MIDSPCINICKIDPVTGVCIGCYRTLDEITCWSRADDAERRAILMAIETRRPGTTSPSPGNAPEKS